MIAGLGYALPLSENISLLIGGGYHLSGIICIPKKIYNNYLSFTVGPGVQVSGIIEIESGLFVSLSGLIGYDVFEIMQLYMPGSGIYNSSVTMAFACGIGFNY